MDIYRQEILDHYKHPHNAGHLTQKDHSVTVFNSACGDTITMEMKFSSDGQRIESIAFSGDGCAISQASASLLTDHVQSLNVQNVLTIPPESVLELLHTSLTPSRMKCALLPMEAIKKCILEWQSKTMV